MQFRCVRTASLLACLCIVAAGCAAESIDDQSDNAASAEPVGTAEQAVWTCEGWTQGLYQYCLTKCGGTQYWHSVGSQSVIPYGQCTEKAQQFCADRGWGNAHDVCWGYNY